MASPGDVLPGAETLIKVGATAPPTTEVGGLRGWSAPRRRNQTLRKYYGNTPTKTIVGPPEDTWQLDCDLTSDDDGQRYIIARFGDAVEFFISFVDEAGNGKYQKVRASGDEPSGANPDEPNVSRYSFGGTEDPVDIGAGPG